MSHENEGSTMLDPLAAIAIAEWIAGPVVRSYEDLDRGLETRRM